MTLLPINKIERVAEKRVDVRQVDVYENSISGDAIHGGTITNFNSTGIKDQAESLQITINDNNVEVAKDLVVKGTVTVENLKYVEAQVPKLNVTDAVMIDHNEVIWKDTLGKSVKNSSLTQLGVLKNLQVDKTLFASQARVGVNTEAPSAEFSVNVDGYEVITTMHERNAYVGTHSPAAFAIGTDNTSRITCKSNGDIVLGNEKDSSANVSVAGRLGVGAKNPQESLHVIGNIKFAERTFSAGSQSPTQGRWDTGSIVWNDKPEINLPVGWVCIKGGTPGSWRPFGQIN
jgi:hypothetical protein|tara:strand:- start:249 stop:1115 length:867 start_codon:yes stop_codon:yes gene_type:complete